MNKEIIACNPDILKKIVKSGKINKSLDDNIIDSIPEKTAFFPITGLLKYTKNEDENYVTSYNDVINICKDAQNNPNIENIIFYFDSPGGYLSGVSGAGYAINELSKYKNVYGVIDGMCASGAYWLASQCGYLIATNTSEIGSIGVYLTLMDDSEFWKAQGINFDYIKSGKFKAIGLEKINEEEKEVIQENIDDFFDEFLTTVIDGRLLNDNQIDIIKSGRTFSAKKALNNGLIDFISKKPIIDIINNISSVSISTYKDKDKLLMKNPKIKNPILEDEEKLVDADNGEGVNLSDAQTPQDAPQAHDKQEIGDYAPGIDNGTQGEEAPGTHPGATPIEEEVKEEVNITDTKIEDMKLEISELKSMIANLQSTINNNKQSFKVENSIISDDNKSISESKSDADKLIEYAKNNGLSIYQASKQLFGNK